MRSSNAFITLRRSALLRRGVYHLSGVFPLGIFLLSVFTISGAARPAAAQDALDQMLARFARMPGLSARFVEEKRIALLAVPLRSEGEIHFAPPGRLLRRVTAPTPSAALIEDGRITMVAGDRREEIDLSQNPVVAGFVDSFRHVLGGDRAALERTYEATLTQEDGGQGSDSWRLRLVPKTEALRRFLREMVLEGEGMTVHRMRMVEVSGDTTVTTFSDVNVDKRWSAAERERTFTL